MRFHLSWLVPLILFSGSVFACSDDSGAQPSTSAADAGDDIAADGGGLDAAPEATPGPPRVTISATSRNGEPKANVRVVFHDAAGAVIETKLTGADGKATSRGDVLPAMASALLGSSVKRDIITWTGLQAGDDIKVHDVVPDSTSIDPWIEVTWPDLNVVEEVFGMNLSLGDCTAKSGGEDSVRFPAYCAVGTSPLLANAEGAEGTAVAHSFRKGKIAVPPDAGTVQIATGPWEAATNVRITGANLPQDATASMTQIVDAQGFSGEYKGFKGGSVTFPAAGGFVDAIQANVGWTILDGAAGHLLMKRVAMKTQITIDASEVLPQISGAQLTSTDRRRPSVAWISSSTAPSDGALVRVSFVRPNGDEESIVGSWTFVVAPGSSNVTAPELPADAADFLPLAGDVLDENPMIFSLEGDAIDYGVVRRQLGQLLEPIFSGEEVLPVMPVNGSYRMTWFKQAAR